MKKVKLVFCLIWQLFMGIISPICLGIIYMLITGNGKGYTYDLGAEKDIWIFIGFIFLLMWFILSFCGIIWAILQYIKTKFLLYLTPIAVYVFSFLMTVFIIGPQYLEFYNIYV